jgi:acetamidase/formamidase
MSYISPAHGGLVFIEDEKKEKEKIRKIKGSLGVEEEEEQISEVQGTKKGGSIDDKDVNENFNPQLSK